VRPANGNVGADLLALTFLSRLWMLSWTAGSLRQACKITRG